MKNENCGNLISKEHHQTESRDYSFFSSATCGFLVIILLFAGCAEKKTPRVSSVPVTAAAVVVQPEPLSLRAVGTVEPIEAVSVKAQVGGVVTRVGFAEGQEVRAGQLLFQIDPRPFQAALDAAMAQLAKDSSQAVNARIQADRYAGLVEKDFVTQEQHDAARTQAAVFESAVRVDKAAVELARLNLSYASITAPISGRTGSLLVKKGNVVKANDVALVVINQMRPIHVRFAIPENQFPVVQRFAAQGELEVRARPDRSGDQSVVAGRLAFLDNAVDPATGTVTLKAEFPNDDGRLWPGQFVDTELMLTVEPEAMTVPAAAVVTGQQGTFVFVIGPDKKVEKRLIKVNRTRNDTAIIAEGLQEGETVVTDGQMRLVPGATVEIKAGQPQEGSGR